ncbi:MAG: hypothetical protein ACI9EF_003013 [Pseudohongiellaceae bacterium]|jgi:hypothetical protein
MTKDPLLATARFLLATLIGLLSFAMVMLAIGVAAVLTVQRSSLMDKIAAADLAPESYWTVLTCLVAIGALLYLGLRFALQLKLIVVSVDLGDPFVPENAQRITRMAWCALLIQFISILIKIAAASLGELSQGHDIAQGATTGGFALALTLFILARVFHTGAQMREDLEGTV